MILDPTLDEKKGIPTRYLILSMIFVMVAVNYGGRATLSIAGTEVAKGLGLNAVPMGYISSAFGQAYLLMQIFGGWLLDKFGPRKVYLYSLFFWSLLTFLQGSIDVFPPAWAEVSMFFTRFMLGFSEAPSFPANAHIVAAWFPTKERSTASAIFNAAQYLSLALLSLLLGWLASALGWEHVLTVMGIIGFVLTVIWMKSVYNPTDHPRMSAAELKYISEGGAVIDIDHKKGMTQAARPKMGYIRQSLTNRTTLDILFDQYFLNTITWSFLTWFPICLVQDKGMSILKVGFMTSTPALFGFASGVPGRLLSDYLVGRGCTLTFVRKLLIVLGMLPASFIILCSYTTSTPLAITLMALALFGRNFGTPGRSVISDAAPGEIVGLRGEVFNVFGNVASIATPLVIGYIVSELHSLNDVLISAGGSALMMTACYLFVVGDIKCMELQKQATINTR